MSNTHPSPTPEQQGSPFAPLDPPRRTDERVDLRLVLGLALLTLAHPVVALVTQLLGGNTTTVMSTVGSWLGPVIAITWILVVWISRAPRPVATLTLTGAFGGVLYAIMVGLIQWVFAGGPLLFGSPFALGGLIAVNTLTGLICGLIGWALQAGTAGRRPAGGRS